ncbi:hypothetical protein [Serratia fonticola]|uniref:hypothetical protein n=1 Tax=Serratia fonticola TaxID=47917 RepID=UPI0024DE5B09|nr:hypothetical protein [Serratia fonticola]MDK2376217.1 hypothetical protein [Serratia fonticola]
MKIIKHFEFYEVDEIQSNMIFNSSWVFFNPQRYGLRIDNNSSAEFILLRVLLGGVYVKYKSPYISNEKQLFLLHENLFKIPCVNVSNKTLMHEIIGTFTPYSFNKKVLNDYFLSQRSNSNFYINMLFEVVNSIYDSKRGQHTKSFLHIYRAFEHLAYSFPLIFVSTASSYEKSYGKLKKYFQDGGDSELAFGRQFIDDNIDSNMLESVVVIEKNCQYISKVFRQLSISDSINFETNKISFPLKLVWDMVIEIRNRYFHHLTGMGNSFNSQLLIDADEFFKVIVPSATTLLSSIYFSILTKRL